MGRFDDAGPLLRKLIGELADEPAVYRHHSTLEPGEPLTHKPSFALMAGVTSPKNFPPAGTEIGMVSPRELIAGAVYPPELRDAAIRRLRLGGAGQSSFLADAPEAIPLYLRPTQTVSASQGGRRISRQIPGDYGRPEQLLDVAAMPPDAIRTLLHEARHATQGYDLNAAPRALSSISSYRQSGIDGRALTPKFKRYFAQPAEVLAWLGGAGDDFVRAEGRLVNNVRDANAVMEMLEAGKSSPDMHPLARQLYVEAYRNNRTARQHINDVLTNYFAVPAAVTAGAAAVDSPDD